MQYPESVEFLYSLGNEVRTVKFGLEAIRTLAAELGDPQLRYRVVHVAGTNGKGSTSALIEAGLRVAGYRTGLYTSPHLIEPTERVRINGAPVSREAFLDAFLRVHAANEELIAEGRLEHHTTYFETVTAMGFLLMAEAGVDIAVVEVGMGGRLDATNIVEPELCVITPIDFDHEQYLGNTLELIAGEKAGILKPGVPAIISRQRPEAMAVLEARAVEIGCPVTRTADLPLADVQLHPRGCEFVLEGERVRCPLAGAHQVVNAVSAAAALRRLGVPPDFAGAVWPGRLQMISEHPEIVLDGAHNPAGARALADHIRQHYAGRRRVKLVYGAMRDKSVQEITEILFPLADEVILTAPDSPRALRPEALAETTDHPAVRIAGSAAEALALARAAHPHEVVFITGSLYLVGEMLALLQ